MPSRYFAAVCECRVDISLLPVLRLVDASSVSIALILTELSSFCCAYQILHARDERGVMIRADKKIKGLHR